MNTHLHTVLERLRFRRRPPTGPLTTAEKATADELRSRSSVEESEPTPHEHDTETE